jgi:NYN domain
MNPAAAVAAEATEANPRAPCPPFQQQKQHSQQHQYQQCHHPHHHHQQQQQPPPAHHFCHPHPLEHQQHCEISIFWDYENVPLPLWCDATVAAKAIVNAVSPYGRIVDRRLYFDFNRSNNIPHRPRDCAGLDSSGFDLVNTPTRNNKETLDKKLIADVLTFAWDSAARGGGGAGAAVAVAGGGGAGSIKTCVVLVTSDGDYAYTLSKLRDRGVFTIVMVGSVHTVAQILVNVADVALSLEGDVLLPEQNRLVLQQQQQQQQQGMFVSAAAYASTATAINGVSGLLYQELTSTKGHRHHARGRMIQPATADYGIIAASTTNVAVETSGTALSLTTEQVQEHVSQFMLDFCRIIKERCAFHTDGWATISEVPRHFLELVGRHNHPNQATTASTTGGGAIVRAHSRCLRDEAIALGLVEVGRRRQCRRKKRQVMVVANVSSGVLDSWTEPVYVRITPKAYRLLRVLSNGSCSSIGNGNSSTLDNIQNHHPHHQEQHKQDHHPTISTSDSSTGCQKVVKHHGVGDCKLERPVVLEEPQGVAVVENDDENGNNLERQTLLLARDTGNFRPLDSYCTKTTQSQRHDHHQQQQKEEHQLIAQQKTSGSTRRQDDGSIYNKESQKNDDGQLGDLTVSKDEIQKGESSTGTVVASNTLKLLLCSIIHQRVVQNDSDSSKSENLFYSSNGGWVDVGQTTNHFQEIMRRNKMCHGPQVRFKSRLARDEAVAEGLVEIRRLDRASPESSITGSGDSSSQGVLHIRLLAKGEELVISATHEKGEEEFAEILKSIGRRKVPILPLKNDTLVESDKLHIARNMNVLQIEQPDVLQSKESDSDGTQPTLRRNGDERLKSTESEKPHASNELPAQAEGSVTELSTMTMPSDTTTSLESDNSNKGLFTSSVAYIDNGTASSSDDKHEELATAAVAPAASDGKALTTIPNGKDPSLTLTSADDEENQPVVPKGKDPSLTFTSGDEENQPIPISSCSVLVCNLLSHSIKIRDLVQFLQDRYHVTVRRAQIELLPHSSSNACNAHVELIRETDATLLIEHAKNSMLEGGGKGCKFQNRSIGIFPNTFTGWDKSANDATSYYERAAATDGVILDADDDTFSLCRALIHSEQHDEGPHVWINEAGAVHKFRSLLLRTKGDPSLRFKISRSNAIANGFIELGRLGAKKGIHDAIVLPCGNDIVKPDDEPSLELYFRLLPPGRMLVKQSLLETGVRTIPDVFSDSHCVVM